MACVFYYCDSCDTNELVDGYCPKCKRRLILDYDGDGQEPSYDDSEEPSDDEKL